MERTWGLFGKSYMYEVDLCHADLFEMRRFEIDVFKIARLVR